MADNRIPSDYIVQFHDETVSVNERGNVTYTEIYMVITKTGTKASDIHRNAKSVRLPVHTSKLNDVPVSSITIDRWTEENVKLVPGLTKTSSSVWKYTVVYSNSGNRGGGASLGEKPPWEENYAKNCTLSPKEYTERSCTTLDTTDDNGKIIPYANQTKKAIFNAVGELVYRDAVVVNQVLSFDYAVKKYNIDTNHLYVGSVNAFDITVAGITVKSGKGRLLSLVPSIQTWNDKEYTQVHVEIELAVGKSVYAEYLIGNSRYAVPVKDDGSADGDLPYPIQLLSCDVSDIADYKNVKWMNKKRRLGYFGAAKKNGKDRLNPALYSYVTEEYPLKKDGTIYIGTKNSKGRYFLKLDDPDLNRIKLTDSHVVTWSTLGFPEKGFMDTSNGAAVQ